MLTKLEAQYILVPSSSVPKEVTALENPRVRGGVYVSGSSMDFGTTVPVFRPH